MNTAAQIAQQAGANDVAQLYGMLLAHRDGQAANVTPYAPQQDTPQAAMPVQAPVPVIGVRPNVPTKLPDNLGARRALGMSLNKFMTDNKLQFAQNGRLDLVAGRGQAIRAAEKKITAWEKKRAEQEAQAAQSGAVNTAQTAQEGAQGTQNTVQDRMLAQRGERAQNSSESVREKSAQNRGNKKAADKGDKELADGYETESGRPLSEADPKEFIIKPNGSRNFGEITKAVSDAVMQQSGVSLGMGEIRLRVGNEIEGLIHAKAHTAEAKQAGYSSVEELIADVAQNFNQIYMREPDNVNGKPTYSLVKTGNKKAGIMNGVAPVYFELKSDDGGNYYIVVTAMPKGDTQLARQTKRDRLIYSSPGLGAATVSGNGAVSHDGKAGAANRGGSPTSDKSDGLSTSTISSEAEESKEKSLNDNEREAVKGLSADAKNVYQLVRDKLAGMKNKKVARAASAGAVLFARHADIIARKVRATLGTPFTAMDYYRTWFDLRYGDAEKPYGGFTQKEVQSQKEEVRKQYEGTAQWMKAPNGENTNLTKDQWLAVRTPAFKAWFGDWENDPKNASKVIDENGEPKVVYHGTKRKDRVGSVFRKDRATSGPMAFFTDLYDIAENYSRNKQDTSIDNPPYEEQFRIKNLHGDMPLHVKWRALSPAKQQEITEKASHVTQDDDGNIVYDEDIDYGIGNFKYEIKTFRGNAIRALEESWLNGGTLFGEEGRFLEVLKLAGVEGKEFEGMFYTDPNGSDEGVFHVFMDMKKPFDTSKDITKGFMRSLRAAAKKAPKQQYENGVDFWDKNALEPMEFVERVERDIENGTTHAWTAIPDWVTALLQKKGYDGIRDTGGKNGGVEHTVYIPFESNQIKSVDNNGAFSPDDVNIFHQSAWHGTPYDFDGFDLGAIGTGEGAQVHGWGLYFAQDRAVSEEYKERLKENHKTLYTMTYDGKPIADASPEVQQALQALEYNAHSLERMGAAAVIATERKWHVRDKENWDGIVAEFDRPLALYEKNPKVSVRALRASVPKHSNAGMTIDAAKPSEKGKRRTAADVVRALNMYRVLFVGYARKEEAAIRALDAVDPEKVHLDVKRPVGKLFEVEIPDDDVLLDEQKPFDEQPKLVQEKLEELFEKNDSIDLLDDVLQLPINPPELRQTLGFMRLARKNIRASKTAIDVLRDVLDKSASRSDRINAYRALLDEDIVDFDEMTDSYEDDIDNVEASRDYLEDVLSSYENGLKRQQGSYQKWLDSLPGDVNLARMVLSKMRSGREIYNRLSSALYGDKAASLALNEVGIKGITYVGGRDGRCYVIFDDKAISIIEKFNQQMNEIVKGTTQDVRDGQRIVSLFEEADESTFLHEMGHLFLLDLERLADMSSTSAEELATVRKWATWSEGQAEEYKCTPFAAEFAYIDARIRAAIKRGDEKKAEKLKRQWEHERFARGFEMYLKHGEAPTKGLRAVFAKFRAFLQRAYQAFTGTGGRATAEVEAVMARMIAMEDSSDLSAYPQGKKTAVYTDSGKKIPVQYRVVSDDDLIASHDAGALEINPGYPAALQPRDRERVMMRQQVMRMSNTLRPEDLADGRNLNQGAPLIRNDGVVLNGNGRTIAIQRAQARNKERATAYRDYLVENAATFGLSKEDIEGVKNPVLVREVQGDISDVLMQDIIGSTTGGARMGASEAAQADAEKITYAMLDAYVPNDKGDLTTAANRNFVAGILHKVVGNGEMNAYLDKDGHVNADGIQRVKRALFACAYGDDELVAKMSESTDDDIRNVSNGMMAAAPMMARLSVKKGVPYVKELQDAIGAAVKQLDTLRRSGESVKDYLRAQALFTEHEDSAEMRAILSFLDENKRSGKRIVTFFSRVATTLDKMETPSGNELFDAEMPSLMDVLEGAQNFVKSGGHDSLFGEYIVKEADTLYEKAAKKFPGITDKEVADHVREAIQLTLDFGHGKGEIRGVTGTSFGKEKLPSERFSVDVDDYRSSGTVRDKKTEKELKRGKIYGLGITRKLVNDGAISLVGQKAESAADLAEIAQVLRHHGYEKFHYVYTDDAGNVKFHETLTARLPAASPIFTQNDVSGGHGNSEYLKKAQERIVTNMSRFGATKFYFIHNHPSGDPTPSREDFNATQALIGGKDIALANAFGGHVILDHNIYSVIDKTGTPILRELKNSYQADYSVPEKPHAVLGTVVTDEDVTQRIADLYGTESETTAFYLTTKGVVRSVQKIHDNFKDVDGATQMNYLRYCARSVGGFRVVLATSNKKLYDSIKDRINSGRDEGILDVVLMKNGRARYPEEKFRSNRAHAWFGQPYTSVRAEQMLENKIRYGSALTARTLENILQLAPALKKAALEYGAKEESGKVTFADEERKQEFLKVAKALLGAGERKTSARRQEALQKMLDGIRLIPPTRVSPRKRVLVDWGREMGVPVVFFKGDPSLHGFHQDGVTFLNADSEITPQWTFWHEAMHWMKANNPDIYSDLVREIRGADGFTKKQLDAYRKEIGAPNMSNADVIEEMLADALPDVKHRIPLLRDIGKRNTGLIQRLVAWIHNVMRRFHDHFYTPKGGLTSLQRRAMVRAFGNLVLSIRDAEGTPIFRVGYEGARIILHDKSPLPEVKYSQSNKSMRWIAAHPFKYDESQTMDENIQRAERLAQEYLDTFGTTDQINTPARQQLRKQIADKLYGKGAKKKEGRAWLVLGLPASGKSTIADPLVEREGALLIDSDEAKKLLPEFSNGLLAGAVHEESANIADEVMIEALSKGDNVVLPIVGKTLSSLNEKRKKLEDAGYEVNLVYVDLPLEKAIERTKARFRHTGRLVPPRYLHSVGLKPRQNYDKIKTEKGVDSYEAWDNDILRGETPRLIERSARPEQKAPRRWMGGRGQHARSLDEGNGLGYRNATGTGSNPLKDNNENRSDNRGGFSMPKFSANTQESRKGNFKWLTGAIRSFVGVAPADNLELPGRPTREVILSPKELERRIKERWIQEKNVISQEKQPGGKIKVTYYPDTHDVGYADWVKSVRQVAKRNPFVQALYKRAHAAMKKQEHLRNEFGKALKEFSELVKNEEDLKSITAVLWQGDAEGKSFSDAELRAMGKNERVIKAYRLVRRELEKAYKMLRDTQTQVKTRSQTLEPESVESFKKNHWIEDADVISVVPRADGTVLLTWRGGRTYDVKGKTMDTEALKLMQKDENINVTSTVPKGDGTFSVSYVERIKPVFRRTGYMPHFFHEWMIYEKYKDPQTGEVRYTSVASGRTMNEAVKIGNEIAAKNKDKQYVLRPKGFDLGAENSVVIGDMDFAQMSRKLAESTEISLADARSVLLNDAGASLKSRHRFFGSLLERKDGKGFDQDVMWVLAHYFNGASRYIAMEEFKPAAISMYERFFGAFDAEPKNLTAKYCKDFINDVNGNPRGVEVWLNDLIKKTWLGKHVADSYGDRVALAINGELSTWNAITKLGLGNFASAAVNFSQFINVGAALNDYGYAAKGLKKALNPSVLDEKIIEASGLLDDINMADDNGGYTQRRGGKVRGIYSAVKKGGEWTLIPFQKADTLMRKAAVLGAYYQGVEQKGMRTAPGDDLSAEALDYAQEINDDANFDYSAANAPNMLRAGSVVTQQLFQFQKYPIMQFEFMYNILKNGTRGQKVRMFVPYVLFCGIGASIPFGSLFNQLFSFLFGLATGDDEDIAQEVKAEVLRWAGKDPVKKAIAETALYGVLAPTFGLDISGRIGMSNVFAGEFYGEKPDSISGIAGQQLGGPMAVSAINMLRQAHEGNPIEALKAFSPALGNMAQAWAGESRTTRHRVNARYDTAYDKIAHALGFRSADESNNAFIMNYEYEQKSKQNRTKQEAIQDYLDDPSDANRRTINALGITERQIKEARIQQERTALERATEGRPNTSGKHGASRHRKEEAKRETLYDTLDDE